MMWLIMKFWCSKIDVFISLKLVMIPSLTFVSISTSKARFLVDALFSCTDFVRKMLND